MIGIECTSSDGGSFVVRRSRGTQKIRKMPCGIPVARVSRVLRLVRHRAIDRARLTCRTTRNAGDGDGDAATASAADATAARRSSRRWRWRWRCHTTHHDAGRRTHHDAGRTQDAPRRTDAGDCAVRRWWEPKKAPPSGSSFGRLLLVLGTQSKSWKHVDRPTPESVSTNSTRNT